MIEGQGVINNQPTKCAVRWGVQRCYPTRKLNTKKPTCGWDRGHHGGRRDPGCPVPGGQGCLQKRVPGSTSQRVKEARAHVEKGTRALLCKGPTEHPECSRDSQKEATWLEHLSAHRSLGSPGPRWGGTWPVTRVKWGDPEG